jgi:hypothetical protein
MRRDFAQYKVDFKRIVETSWNNQIILLPPEDPKDGLSDADYMALVANPRMPAHVECSLTIRFVDTLGSANAAIQVVHLKRADDPTVNRRLMPMPGEEEFRSRAWLITNEDIHRKKTSDYRWPNLLMSQVAAAHEIGHWLGRPTALGNLDRYLGHIDGVKYAKTGPSYDQLQYGGTAATTHRSWAADRWRPNTTPHHGSIGCGGTPGRCSAGSSSIAAASSAWSPCRPASNASLRKPRRTVGIAGTAIASPLMSWRQVPAIAASHGRKGRKDVFSVIVICGSHAIK